MNSMSNKEKITFNTSREGLRESDLSDIHYELYGESTYQEIEDILTQHGINISIDEIREAIEVNYEYDEVIDQFNQKYADQLAEIEKLNIILDKECIHDLVMKVFNEEYLFNNIPKPDYISEAFDEFEEIADEDQPEYLLKILKSMNKLNKFCKGNNLDKIFRGHTYEPIGQLLARSIENDMNRCKPDAKMTKAIADEMFALLENYEVKESSRIYRSTLRFFEKFGVN